MRLDTSDAGFASGLRDWLSSLENDTLSSFDAVLDVSPGYYPTTLYELWNEVREARGIGATVSVAIEYEQARIPVAHPLDFDWRFAPSSLDLLSRRIHGLSGSQSTVLYFGTPTLFGSTMSRRPVGVHILLDANRAMVNAMKRKYGEDAAIEVRLGRDAMPIEVLGDVAVLDPPWYPMDTSTFLASASKALRIGATILLSQPAIATRPGVQAERDALLTSLQDFGLELVSAEPVALRYLTPHFEHLSMVSAQPGLEVRRDWRPGDLLTFTKVGAGTAEHSDISTAEGWSEVSFGPVRVKLRSSEGPDLAPVRRGLDRLTTVSRRDPDRDRVGLWTSGNRVRKLKSSEAIASLITMCDSSLADMKFSQLIVRAHATTLGIERRVADRLFDLLLLEYQEHVAGGYGGKQ